MFRVVHPQSDVLHRTGDDSKEHGDEAKSRPPAGVGVSEALPCRHTVLVKEVVALPLLPIAKDLRDYTKASETLLDVGDTEVLVGMELERSLAVRFCYLRACGGRLYAEKGVEGRSFAFRGFEGCYEVEDFEVVFRPRAPAGRQRAC